MALSNRRARRPVTHPFNLLVTGHAATGKTSFLRSFVTQHLPDARLSSKALDGISIAGSSSPTLSKAGGTLNGGPSYDESQFNATMTGASTEALLAALPPDHIAEPTASSCRFECDLGALMDSLGDVLAASPTSGGAASIINGDSHATGATARDRLSIQIVDTPGLVMPSNIGKFKRAYRTNDPAQQAQQAQLAPHLARAETWAGELAAWAISRYEATLVEESKVRRAAAKHRRDAQIHAALYFLDPLLTYSCRGLTPLDRVALPILARRTNVVLVLGKSDLLSTRQAGRLRRWIADEIAEENGMRLYGFVDPHEQDQLAAEAAAAAEGSRGASRDELHVGAAADDEDDEDDEDEAGDAEETARIDRLLEELRMMSPFTVFNPEDVTSEASSDEDDGLPGPRGLGSKDSGADVLSSAKSLTGRRGSGSRAGSAAGGRRAATAFRTFPWGRADAHNPAHADVGALLHTLLASHRDRLRDITRDVFYEAWRTDKLLEVRRTTAINAAAASAASAAAATAPTGPAATGAQSVMGRAHPGPSAAAIRTKQAMSMHAGVHASTRRQTATSLAARYPHAS